MAIWELLGPGRSVYFMLLLNYVIWSEECLLSRLCIIKSYKILSVMPTALKGGF